MRVFLVNSKSDETLDYKRYEQDGIGLTAIAVGGLSLSRGLTIEGLCVSYMYRNTRMYDTLMQMGRWFGYRPDYEDLCRVHLSEDSVNWYAHISEASEELRQQIKQMRKDRLSPVEFGLYVRAHPDSLLVTAVNKMRSGEKKTVKQNFSGRICESYILPVNEKISKQNRLLIRQNWESAFEKEGKDIEATAKGWYIKDVNLAVISKFLLDFRVHNDFIAQRNAQAYYLDLISEKYTTGDVLLISLGNLKCQESFSLGPQDRKGKKISQFLWRATKDRIASRGDEKLGLTGKQMLRARKLVDENDKNPSDIHYRIIRNKPLLMIHSLNLGVGVDKHLNVPAYGISYPLGNYSEEIDVVANKVWIDQFHGDTFDMPDDDEEDYDE